MFRDVSKLNKNHKISSFLFDTFFYECYSRVQRGVYATAVAVLEQITPYCSTNSKMGGKVFLELAMAYEAVGRADEAITVYSTLSRSRIQDIRFNAQRLLYGIEAINFMRNEAHDDNFSRKKVSQDFIDATGFNKIAEKFDKRYTTAYVDMKNPNFYKRLTENVVRSTREARLIILKAIHHGEVGHLRIIQALQTINREFDSAMRKEAEQDAMHERKSIAVMNGVPIQRSIPKSDDATNNPNEFALGSPDQMLANFDGEWRLQLVADKKGDGVTFFYSKVAWQRVDIDTMIFETCVPSGFAKIRQKGYLQFLGRSRLIEREQKPSPKSWLDIPVSLVSCTGPSAACQQILAVDSELCITRQCDSNAAKANTLREYFSVWRRVEKGTFSRAKIT